MSHKLKHLLSEYYSDDCTCASCIRIRNIRAEIRGDSMTFNSAKELADCYIKAHEMIRQLADIIKWPSHGRPDALSVNLRKYLESLPQDEWTEYLIRVAPLIDSLIWSSVPGPKKEENL